MKISPSPEEIDLEAAGSRQGAGVGRSVGRLVGPKRRSAELCRVASCGLAGVGGGDWSVGRLKYISKRYCHHQCHRHRHWARFNVIILSKPDR